jgi:hypothetical protein
MDIPTTLVFVTILILTVAYIVRPFLTLPADAEKRPISSPSSATLRGRADLLAERNRIYRALRGLDFDYQTDKIAGQEYAAQRRELVAQGVAVLQELDELLVPDVSPEADPIEAAVQAVRQKNKTARSNT